MIADTAVITRPVTSRLIKSKLRLKFLTGGLVIAFFDPCRVARVRGLLLGPDSGFTFAELRGVTGLFIWQTLSILSFNRALFRKRRDEP
ncbi:MAG: hypothetical protein WAW61_13150 [Methylococcaceae bacterium]